MAALEQQVGILLAVWNHSDCLKSTQIACEDQWVSACAFSPLQILLSAKDFENERIDRQSLQHQLKKVLKELCMARDQISKLESAVSGCSSQTGIFVSNNRGLKRTYSLLGS